MKTNIVVLGVLVFTLSQCQQASKTDLTKSEMIKIVKALDNQFSVGVQKKDSVFLTNIYSDSAQYVQPNRTILFGKAEIEKDWSGFLKLKEEPIDLVLNIHHVDGNREIIYETGDGYTLLADSTRWNFNYVNVWRLQKDGVYKLEIDTYTPLDIVE
ncbi:MAG TPA: hypothetical protein PLJ60_01485 [Chryseolinea sp.]|nr:hypothetical protein [Chryseolinea sp.]HPM28979.1 hypothetical protein [Chryseolinea sp.]